MKTANLDREIRSRIDSFVGDLSQLVKIAALEAVHDALGANLEAGARADGSATARQPRRGAGRPPLVAAKRGRRAGKRSSEAVLETAATTLAYIQANDGQRLEEIAKGLSVTTKELKLPIAKLLEQKKLKTKGQKRGTRYFAR
jgi:hypothetical protein